MPVSSLDPHPTVGAIVLNYLNWPQTLRAVDELLAQADTALDVTVVDNASPNDSWAELEARLRGEGQVRLVSSGCNGGYACGNNYGARQRLAWAPADYLLIANSDVRFPDRRAVAKMVAFAEQHPDAGLVGPRVLTTSGFAQGPYRRPHPLVCCLRYLLPMVPLGQRLMQRLWPQLWPPQNSRRCFAVVGACFLARAAAFAGAGLFDEATFLGAEEYIVAERMRQQGLAVYYVPDAWVVHEHEQSAIRHSGGEGRYLPAGVESMKYYFRCYQQASEWSIRLFEQAAAFYGRCFLPLRQKLPL